MEFAGRVAIVTGGGTGIGRATALRLAKSGARAVVVNYSRSATEAEATANDVIALGADAMTHRSDVADESQVKALVAATVDRYGGLDVLVNNAGTTHFIPHPDLDGLTDAVWNDILGVNLKGTFYCCRAGAPELKKTGGAIVNIASIAAHRASGSSIAYAVSKAGVLQLTRALALALAPEVRVNSVSPGLVSTRWFRSRFGDDAAAAQEEAFAKQTPVQKIATPDDVARAVVALLENDLITGQDLVVDGGKNVLYQTLV
ncbi:MAG TPA: SDR family oxidoreductase [Candidatus Dormibacteraeota bacterium]|nr:SDR family oxidoreductase [Candidatus Dormibacteraeota bacterium]